MLKDENVENAIRDFIRGQKDITVDRYSDEGGNGEMYFGMRSILNDRVALKFYYSSSKIESHNEPVILKSIEHPNILKVYDAKVISDYYSYFLTPEISGGDLQKYMDSNIVDVETALSITVGILNGLSILHCQPNNILHRDLKPKNVLIDAKTLTPIISDFGSIKKYDKNIGSVKASKCTYIYRPKEAIINDQYTVQSDIYQVGLILFQLLGGRFPDVPVEWLNEKQRKKLNGIIGSFEQWKYIESVFDKLILSNKLLMYDTLPVYISEKIKKIIKAATHPDLDKRFSTASEFLNAIHKAQSGLINYWIDNDIVYSKTKTHYYRITNTRKGLVLEYSKDGINFRKDNSHSGSLDSIIKIIEK